MSKQIVSLLIMLLIGSVCWADGVMINSYRYAAASSPTYIVSEDCEGSGKPSGWTSGYTEGETTGSSNWDYATSPAPLLGSESLRMTSDGFRADYTTFTSLSPCYIYWQTYIDTLGSTDSDFLHIDDASANLLLIVRREATTGYLKISDEASGGKLSSTVINIDTLYHFWLEYTASGSVKLYVSTTSTKPGTPAISYTTGNTASCGLLALVASYGSVMLFDKIRVDDATIGSNPS